MRCGSGNWIWSASRRAPRVKISVFSWKWRLSSVAEVLAIFGPEESKRPTCFWLRETCLKKAHMSSTGVKFVICLPRVWAGETTKTTDLYVFGLSGPWSASSNSLVIWHGASNHIWSCRIELEARLNRKIGCIVKCSVSFNNKDDKASTRSLRKRPTEWRRWQSWVQLRCSAVWSSIARPRIWRRNFLNSMDRRDVFCSTGCLFMRTMLANRAKLSAVWSKSMIASLSSDTLNRSRTLYRNSGVVFFVASLTLISISRSFVGPLHLSDTKPMNM